MPRLKFRMAGNADHTDVDCQFFARPPGRAPSCEVLNHPWCLAAGSKGPSACKFRMAKEAEAQDG